MHNDILNKKKRTLLVWSVWIVALQPIFRFWHRQTVSCCSCLYILICTPSRLSVLQRVFFLLIRRKVYAWPPSKNFFCGGSLILLLFFSSLTLFLPSSETGLLSSWNLKKKLTFYLSAIFFYLRVYDYNLMLY